MKTIAEKKLILSDLSMPNISLITNPFSDFYSAPFIDIVF